MKIVQQHMGTGENMLGTDDPDPVLLHNAAGRSAFLLTGDHAGNHVPARLGDLGLPRTERDRHIGWDIGIGPLGRMLADRLDAPFVSQAYSRLVIDCNRDPASPEAVPVISDGTVIPGNEGMDQEGLADRVAAIHAPYHDAIARMVAARAAAARPALFIALHSFTPALGGVRRPWDVGVLHWTGDRRFALALLAQLRAVPGLCVGDNQPYRMDATDYSVPRHAIAAGLPYAEIELRQDLISDRAGQVKWSGQLAIALRNALDRQDV
ncbi:N-formylglutamate amidohydrolase [Sphingobium sp. AN641]|uniref:N-formylglutamate amidohydrolase n=1 Tax=Sphingobium sp. AN641 TaxID=3133443 RepID=UPI0030BD05B2